MSIWFNKNLHIDSFTGYGKNTMGQHLGLAFSEVGDDHLKMTMPVDERTIQPHGLLHGGASAALAETIGSIASSLVIDPEKFVCVGLEINANHVRGVRSGGLVTATCTPLHLGSSTHVWDIKIHDEQLKLVCISRLTVAILQKR